MPDSPKSPSPGSGPPSFGELSKTDDLETWITRVSSSSPEVKFGATAMVGAMATAHSDMSSDKLLSVTRKAVADLQKARPAQSAGIELALAAAIKTMCLLRLREIDDAVLERIGRILAPGNN